MKFIQVRPSRDDLANIRKASCLAAQSAMPKSGGWEDSDIRVEVMLRTGQNDQLPEDERKEHPLVARDYYGMNYLIPIVDGNASGTDVYDCRPWSDFRKGFPLTSEGTAQIDFAVYERGAYGSLLNNVVVFYTGKSLIKITETTAHNRRLYP